MVAVVDDVVAAVVVVHFGVDSTNPPNALLSPLTLAPVDTPVAPRSPSYRQITFDLLWRFLD